jgi:multiple sugar transport system permease protein
MLKISFTPRELVFILPPKWLTTPTFIGYVELFSSTFLLFFKNSVLVALGTVLLSLLAGSFAAYSFSRFAYKGRKALMLFTLSAQMFPWALLLISLYMFFVKIHLIDTLWAVLIAHTTFALPMTIWILKGYFDTIPISLEESAYIDGCSRMRTFRQIILPLTKPGITAAAIYIFIFSWNDFLFGLTLTVSDSMRTLAPGISMTFVGEFEFRWVEMMSASVVITIPILILFLFLQNAFVDGMTAGAVKE